MDAQQQSTSHADDSRDGPETDGSGFQRSSVAVPPDWSPPEVDVSVASIARVYDYFLGGKDNYPVDREIGRQVVELLPWLPAPSTATANR